MRLDFTTAAALLYFTLLYSALLQVRVQVAKSGAPRLFCGLTLLLLLLCSALLCFTLLYFNLLQVRVQVAKSGAPLLVVMVIRHFSEAEGDVQV
jgi:hypothetical protein